MDAKIAILGHKDFIEGTKTIIQNHENGMSIDLFECFIDECFDILPILEQKGTEMIITGRANKKRMEGRTHIPIITFHITPIDILSAIQKSIRHSRRMAIALSHFEDLEYDYSILQDLLGIDLTFISYSTEYELREKMQLFAEAEGVVIGTSIASVAAKEFGLKSILVYSLENTINDSLRRAMEIIHFKREEEALQQKFKAILHSVRDGILATNERNEVSMINHSASKLLQIPEGSALGKPLSDVVPKPVLNRLTSMKESFQDQIIKLEQITLNANRTSILVKGLKAGSVYTLQDITEIKKIEQRYRLENEAKGLVAKGHFEDIIAESSLMKSKIERAKKFAKTESTVLIIGETGTGKEILAQSLHNYSNRKSSPFVAINCAALPEALLESELFGYEDGAFTGAAKKGKKGLFELAHNGTVFLDEINSISLHFQARLLRVLQEKEIVRVGGTKVIPIDVRIVAASNQDLLDLVSANQFRADLFYRLNLLKINLPPLRQRLEDLMPIARTFIGHRNQKLLERIDPLSDNLFKPLFAHHFPGNVRELFNILERFIILCEIDKENSLDDYKELLLECMDDYPAPQIHGKMIEFELKESFKESLAEAERSLMQEYRQIFAGDKSLLSEKTGIGRTTLYRKLKELNVDW